MSNYNDKRQGYKLLIIALILGGIVIILYWRYLTGEYLFLFPNVVNDGMTQFFPRYLKLARLFSNERRISTYTLSDGFGGWLSINQPIDMLIVMFGEEAVPYLIGVKEVVCIFVAGILIGLFLMEVGWDFTTCVLGSVAYALSYQLIIGSCWSGQAEMAIVIAFFLLAAEKIFHKKYICGTIGIVISLALFKMCFGLYQLLLYGGLCAIYFAIRLGAILVCSKRVTLRKLVIAYSMTVLFCVLSLLILQNDKLFYIFGSDRFLNGFTTWKDEWKNTFSTLNFQNIATSYYRTIAPNIMGISWLDNYHGMPMQSCLDDGGFYTTILAIYCSVLLLDRKNHCKGRRFGMLALSAIAIMVCFPGIRLFINGFVNVTYKLSRLWMVLFFGGIMVYVWQEKIAQGQNIHLKPLMVTAILVSISLIIPFIILTDYLYVKDVIFALVFLWLYLLLFCIWQAYPVKRVKIRYLFLLVCCVEGICLNYGFVNNRDALTVEELAEGYYNDGTKSALEVIQKQDENGFYRINKSYQSVMLCDPIVQDYYSTVFYHGGVDNVGMTSFIKTFGLPTLCNKMGYLSGTYGYPALSSILGVKYDVTNGGQCIESGSKYIEAIGEKYIFANPNALPLVFGYQIVLTHDEFMKYSLSERHDVIVQGCYVDDETLLSVQNDMDRGPGSIKTNNAEPLRTYIYKAYGLSTPLEFDTLKEDEIAVIRVYDEEDKCLNLYWKTEKQGWYDRNFQTMSIYPENGESYIEISNQEGLQGIIFYAFDDKVIESLDEVVVEIYKRDEYNRLYEKEIEELRRNGIVYQSISENEVTGILTMEQDGIIFISIPYDSPYTYYINGANVETVPVNGIFTGIIAEEGRYMLQIKMDDN